MTCGLAEREAVGRLYRIGKAPDPWRWPEWTYAHDDGTFWNRWDDPRRLYRVLYAGTTQLGCFLEVLAWFRPDSKLASELDEIKENDPDLPSTREPGTLPGVWLEERRLGEIDQTSGRYADVGHSTSLACLNRVLAAEVLAHKLDELDGAAIRMKAPRSLTMAISRFVYEASTAIGESFAGIFYLSRWGDDLHNYALFENGSRWSFEAVQTSPLSEDMPDFRTALEMHRIRLVNS